MNCKSCGYKVDRYSPDGAHGKYCSCLCKSVGNEGLYWSPSLGVLKVPARLLRTEN